MPRAKEQFEAMKTATVERINHIAALLFAKKGLAATNIKEISKDAGMSMGLMYHYYKSKEDLYNELIKIAVISANGFLKELEAEKISSAEKIRKFTANILKDLNEKDSSTPYYFILMNQALFNKDLPEIKKENIDMAFDSFYAIQSIIESGQTTGEIKKGNPVALATLYLSTFHGLCSFKVMAVDIFSSPDPMWINEILLI